MIKLNKKFLICVISAIIIIFITNECRHRKEMEKYGRNIINYQDSVQRYVDKYNQVVYYNKILSLQTKRQMQDHITMSTKIIKLENNLKKYKKIQSGTVINQKVEIIKDTIWFTGIMEQEFKPIKLLKQDKYKYFAGTFYKNKLVIDSLNIPDEQVIILGNKKVGFLKTENTVEVIHSNPYITVNSINSSGLDCKPKWFERKGVIFAGGIVSGLFILKLIQ